jgi:hypothetical protein
MQEMQGVWTSPQAGRQDAIATEAAAILESSAFQRSEVLSRLLSYLVRMTAEGRSVKAFEIAVDGLGRAEHESLDSDNYARVVVARLRKALAHYYSTGTHEHELHIDPGSYVLRLKSIKIVPAPQDATVGQPRSESKRRAAALLGLVAIVLIGAALFALSPWFSSDDSVWADPNFPTLSVRVAGQSTPELDDCRRDMIASLGGYVGLRLVDLSNAKPDLELRIYPSESDQNTGQLFELVHRSTDRILWSHRTHIDTDQDADKELRHVAFAIASPGGVIESFARRRGIDPQSPYGCWLEFTESIKSYNSMGNAQLKACAKDWYSASPDHPAAALLYSWSITDSGALTLRSGERTEKLRQALAIANDASSMHSQFASLYIARMRAHSFLGERHGAVESARKAIATSQENRMIIGMAASGLALWNEPDGERILTDLAAEGEEQLPWENVGLFVAAMMHDDPQAAGLQLEQLAAYDRKQPILQILRGAYLARIGKRTQADAVLRRMEDDPRIWIAGTDKIIDRLPMAPEAKKRLREWLAIGAR